MTTTIEQLRRRRQELGAAQEAVAPLLGVTTRTLSRWETGRGKRPPHPNNLAAYDRVLEQLERDDRKRRRRQRHK